MSAEVERVFSSAKRLIGPDQMRLNDDTIEYLELLKYWWSKGIVTQQHK
jgi:hAT family C-terminal dimerisation region